MKKLTDILCRERGPGPGWCGKVLIVMLPLILHMGLTEGSEWPPGGQWAIERGMRQACCGADSDTERGWGAGSGWVVGEPCLGDPQGGSPTGR